MKKSTQNSGSVTFKQAIDLGFSNYAEFNGRASRSEFWWWVLFTALIAAALSLFESISLGGDKNLGSLLSGMWSLAILLPSLAVGVRRLRDADYGWGNMFWGLIPFAGIIVLVIMWAQPSKK